MDPNQEREEHIKNLVDQFEARLRKRLVLGPQKFDDIEVQAEEIGEAIKQEIIRDVTESCGSGYAGTRHMCRCGRPAKYSGMRHRSVIGIHGACGYQRAWYHCGCCRHGFSPLDEQLDVGAGECSRRLQALIARFCTYLPFELAASEMEAVCDVRVSATTMQTYAKRIGHQLQQAWNRRERQLWAGRTPACQHRPRQLHASMDGVFVHVGGEWREAKLGVVYERGDEGIETSDYYATMAPSATFGRKLRTLAYQHGAQYCRDVAVVADGAPWIWQEAGKYFPQSVQVLDFYHATQHLWVGSHARFGEGSQAGRDWMVQQKDRLLHDRVLEVIEDVKTWNARKPANRKIKKNLVDYLSTHSKRMTYQTFKGAGYHIGSGVVEAGCKTVVKARMAGAGMRWEAEGAEAMLHLCAHWRSRSTDGFMNYTS